MSHAWHGPLTMKTDDWSYHTPIAKKLLSTGEAQLALGNTREGIPNLIAAREEITATLNALGVSADAVHIPG